MLYRLTSLILLFLSCATALADELTPAYIELSEQKTNHWSLIWKVSERSILGQTGELILPESCQKSQVSTQRERGNVINTLLMFCSDEIWGQHIGIRGLERSNTDALVRIATLRGQQTIRLTPNQPVAVLLRPSANQISNVGLTYAVLGIEHILQGYDHLLFVIAMVLLVSGWTRIVWTITAFTLAHSFTLIGTTFGYLSLPPRPVETIIALSIVFVALEVLQRNSAQRRLSQAYPWFIAFLFGLLHGFGFAGALAEIGLPKTDVPLALLTFNLGVELGQLAIVAVTLSVLLLLRRWAPRMTQPFTRCCAYIIGITSTYWLIERIFI